jgi:hypothetical protein
MNDQPLLRFCPMPRNLRSFAVLRRFSLATLAQRLRQSQDDSEVELSTEYSTPDFNADSALDGVSRKRALSIRPQGEFSRDLLFIAGSVDRAPR